MSRSLAGLKYVTWSRKHRFGSDTSAGSTNRYFGCPICVSRSSFSMTAVRGARIRQLFVWPAMWRYAMRAPISRVLPTPVANAKTSWRRRGRDLKGLFSSGALRALLATAGAGRHSGCSRARARGRNPLSGAPAAARCAVRGHAPRRGGISCSATALQRDLRGNAAEHDALGERRLIEIVSGPEVGERPGDRSGVSVRIRSAR